jgi:3-oxoacyl-[acyl-carrier protein] reductase
MRLASKIALVTGGAGGFGEGIVRRFAQEGARVVVADVNEAGAARVAQEIGGNASAVAGDVSKAADVQAMVDATLRVRRNRHRRQQRGNDAPQLSAA